MTPLFIVGAPRSGTTLLQHIIGSHSYYCSLPDTFFFEKLSALGVEYYHPDHIATKDDIKLIIDNFQEMTGFKINTPDCINHKKTIKDIFEAIIYFFNTDHKEFWVEKTPTHALYMLCINRFYPDAKFIHIVRDPVDSVGSMMSLKPTTITDYRLNYLKSWSNRAKLWAKCVKAALSYPYQDKVLHIFYEELVLNPECQVKKVCCFLDIPFEQNMLTSFAETARKKISIDHCPWQKENLASDFKKQSIHKWRKRLSPYTIWLIQKHVKDLAIYLGYYSQDKFARSKLKKMLCLINDKTILFLLRLGLEKKVRKIFGEIIK